MFGIGAGELVALIVIAVLLFGPEKLPDVARKVARIVHYLRNIANNAQTTIRSELGPGYEDFDIRDPKAFVRKHLLEEFEPLVADVRAELNETAATVRELRAEVQANADEIEKAVTQPAAASAATPAAVAVPVAAAAASGAVGDDVAAIGPLPVPFDPEST